MSKTIEIQTLDEFKKIVSDNKHVLLDFYAEWCGPCTTLMPEVEKTAKELNVNLYKVNIDDNTETAEHCDIPGLPCIAVYTDGKKADEINSAKVDLVNEMIKKHIK